MLICSQKCSTAQQQIISTQPVPQSELQISETQSQNMDFEDDASTTSARGSENPMTTENENPWMPMVEETLQKH